MEIITVSEHIQLVPIQETDAEQIFELIDNQREYLGRWLPFVQYTQSVDDERDFIRSVLALPEDIREMIFCIYFDGEFVGLIGLKFNELDNVNRKTELGYWLSENYQGKGIVTSSCNALINLAFNQLNYNRVQIKCAVKNEKSKNIPKRLGFTFEGIERDGELLAGEQFTDLEVYSILKKEWI